MKNGVLLIDKPKGITSRDAVDFVCKRLGMKKVGHVGSLDPFATGLLLITVNDATKIGSFLESLDKVYVAELTLGERRESGDITTEVVETKDVPILTKTMIEEVFNSFIGPQKQLPPMYSALKHQGKPLYKYAREGIEISREPRDINIYDLKCLNYTANSIIFICRVSKGTYIRTLGEDLAVRLGTVGYLSNLTRTKVGSFSLENAFALDSIDENKMLSIVDVLSHMPTFDINTPATLKDIKNGRPLSLPSKEALIFLKSDDLPLAIYEKHSDGLYYSKRGFSSEND